MYFLILNSGLGCSIDPDGGPGREAEVLASLLPPAAMRLGSRMSAVTIAATKLIRNIPDSFIAIIFLCDLDGKR